MGTDWETGRRPPSSAVRSQGGFTILELTIGLFIVLLVLSAAFKWIGTGLADEDLRTAARQLAILAKTARSQSLGEGRGYEIVLDEYRFILRPALTLEKTQAPTREISLPKSIRFLVFSWDGKRWLRPQNSIWTFSPTGLCSPLRVRFERNPAWVEEEFNPLTANRQSESFFLP